MAIKEYVTRTGKEIVVEGFVNGVFFNELKEKKDYGKQGKSWIPTHSVNIIVDEDKVGLGLTDKETIRVKDKEGNYHDLVKGQKISVVVSPNGEYKGVQQWAGRASDVIVEEQAPASAAPQGGAQKGFTGGKKDMTGVESGHAINAAIGLLAGDAVDNPEAVIELAKKFHDLTSALKSEYAKKYPEVSDYDIGARVGQAVLSATQIVADFEDVEAVARVTIETISPAVLAYVSTKKEETKPAAVKKTAAKKAAPKKSTTKKEEVAEPQEPEVPEEAYTDIPDDDIPF